MEDLGVDLPFGCDVHHRGKEVGLRAHHARRRNLGREARDPELGVDDDFAAVGLVAADCMGR